MEIGDLVTRKSYNDDIIFIILNILNGVAYLASINYRLNADSPLSDLNLVCNKNNSSYFMEKNKHSNSNTTLSNNEPDRRIIPHSIMNIFKKNFASNTLILHIDGDKFYLKESMKQYKFSRVNVLGFAIHENKQPEAIKDLLNKYNPKIIVITGHDSLINDKPNSTNINDYKNSKYFIDSTKIARSFNSDYNDLVIISGGCKSNYEELMNAGANFASSPERKLINITDPVNIACLLATSSKENQLDIDYFINKIPLEPGCIGGIATCGQYL